MGAKKRFSSGQTVYSIGLDSGCLPVVVRLEFVRYASPADDSPADCVVSEGGLHMPFSTAELHRTPDALRRRCREERARWRAAVEGQLAGLRRGGE